MSQPQTPLLALAPAVLCLATSCATLEESGRAAAAPEAQMAIETVIRDAYIDGVFVSRDAALVREGFAPIFVFNSYWNGSLSSRTLEEWLGKLKLDGKPRERTIEAEIEVLEVTGTVAVARVEIFLDGSLTYTDYLGLYETDGGWKIVTKTFYGHP